MKKMPTLFQREFDHHRVVNINPVAPPELQWVLDGEGIATEKVDGACCAIINGTFYNRYDAKKDKRGMMKLPPEGAIPCDVPDPVTGHWPHWVKVEESDPADRWFVDAYKRAAEKAGTLADGTYEAIGPHFQSNPYHLAEDVLVRHGAIEIDLPDRSFEGIRDYLERHAIEGIVFWKDGTKTVVKAQGDEQYIPEVGLAMCICKKVMGNTRDYYRVFKHWMKKV